jgi:hypothetical protein
MTVAVKQNKGSEIEQNKFLEVKQDVLSESRASHANFLKKNSSGFWA